MRKNGIRGQSLVCPDKQKQSHLISLCRIITHFLGNCHSLLNIDGLKLYIFVNIFLSALWTGKYKYGKIKNSQIDDES